MCGKFKGEDRTISDIKFSQEFVMKVFNIGKDQIPDNLLERDANQIAE
jgi:hypothetical protein